MCGIAGFNFQDHSLLARMCQAIKHRGPDQEGYFEDERISLGCSRLSIIDIAGGRQPISNEDGSIVVVYNGEIYNYIELKNELLSRGHSFHTNSDTEVIVHSYEEWGDDCCARFNGMFAFALWDRHRRELTLARDRYGIKPLYYTMMADGRFLFGSEIKAILQFDLVKRNVDLEALHYYLNLRFVPLEKTLFRNIARLRPGSLIKLDGKRIRFKRYWNLVPTFSRHSEGYFAERIRQVLHRAVERNLVSDVPLGILLSGGLDSSAILAFASQVRTHVKAFTMGFGEATDEIEHAKFVAQAFGAEHVALLGDGDVLREYPKMIWYADMPKRNLYPYYVMKEAHKHVKVLLGGLGADELFGGYEWKYQFALDIEKARASTPRKLRMLAARNTRSLLDHLSGAASIFEVEHLHELKRVANIDSNLQLYSQVLSLDEVFHQKYLQKIYSRRMNIDRLPRVPRVFWEYFSNQLGFVDQTMIADFSVKLPDDFLHVEDTMSMANSVEARVPFLDNELVELAFSIPSSLKYKDGTGKYIFKKAMEGVVPNEVLAKEKQGFGGNIGLQFSKEIAEYARQTLPDGYTVKDGFVRKKYISDVLRHRTSVNLIKHYIVIWDLLAFEMWYRMYILDKSPQPKLDLNSIS